MMTVLVYRLGLLGDTVVALPAFRAIRDAYPSAKIVLLHNRVRNKVNPAEILYSFKLIDEDISYSGHSFFTGLSLWLRLRKSGPYDVVINLPPSFRTNAQIRRDALFFRLCGASKFIGFQPISASLLSDHVHETDFLMSRLEEAGLSREGAFATSPPPALSPDLQASELFRAANFLDKPREDLVALGIWGNRQSTRWAQENYRLLGESLVKKLGLTPVILGAEGEWDIAERLVKYWGRGVNLAGKTSILQSYHILRRCGFYVGNDTGQMHLAALAGLKCVAIMSARNPIGRWDPYGKGHIVLRKHVPCEECLRDDCSDKGNMCLRMISVAEVFEACLKIHRMPV